MKIEMNDVMKALEETNAGTNETSATVAAFKAAGGDVERAWKLSNEELGFPEAVIRVASLCAKAGKTSQGSAFLDGKVILPSGKVMAVRAK